jgi:SWIM zinc finger
LSVEPANFRRMPARWSADSVLALAPDDSSRRAATGLGRPAPWNGTGATGELVWGLCAGSGKDPYQTIVDLSGPAYRCSCPSRKFPCKHALGLLLLWAGGGVPEEPAPADYARAWLEARREKASKSSSAAPDGEAGRTDAGKDESAAARRAEERAQRVSAGLAELQEWLRDQVRVGLAASVSGAGAPRAGMPATGHADAIAARMVDAQAPGVASMLRGLSALPWSADDEWPARLLGEYAQLHLLARAHGRLDTLPPGLAAVVRSRVGYTTSRQEVLARPAVTDHWLVIAVRDLVDGTVPGRRIWLLGRDTGQHAMLLTFAGGGYWQDPETAGLRAGAELFADLHYYPGQPPLRALAGERHAGPVRGKCPKPDGDIDGLLAGWATGIERDPWLTTWPVLLTGTPVPPRQPAARTDAQDSGAAAAGNRWHLVDRADAALPLAERESLWTLLAVSGGNPVTVAGEWNGNRLLPLTVWHGHQAVPL